MQTKSNQVAVSQQSEAVKPFAVNQFAPKRTEANYHLSRLLTQKDVEGKFIVRLTTFEVRQIEKKQNE